VGNFRLVSGHLHGGDYALEGGIVLGAEASLAQIAAALSKTTELLAGEMASPGANRPELSDFEWRIAAAAAAMHGISPLLHSRLRWQGPAAWQEFLEGQRGHSLARHQVIERLLRELQTSARAAGIPVVVLKGPALHGEGLYAAGERPMGDVDLLIRAADSAAIARALAECDYAPGHAYRRHWVFEPAQRRVPQTPHLGEHIDNPIKVEVHTRIAESLPSSQIDITDSILPTALRRGLNEYPSRARLMLHLLLHAAGNMRARALRLIQLHDIALLGATFCDGDWGELLGLRRNGLWWAAAPLALVLRYYPGAVPQALYDTLRDECPALLRRAMTRHRLTDVSWSNIYVQAFPGLEYSRTLGDATRYIGSRVWPSPSARAELRQGSAQIIGVESVPWYRQSHSRRILRWIFSRPPRVQTLLCVRTSLSDGSQGL
jgi:Uncharacterised nucleotidyltransferase